MLAISRERGWCVFGLFLEELGRSVGYILGGAVILFRGLEDKSEIHHGYSGSTSLVVSSFAEEEKKLLVLFCARGANMVLGKGNKVVWTRLSVGRGIFFAGILCPGAGA